MPYFPVAAREFFVHDEGVLVDTNVLVAGFDRTDEHHASADILLREYDLDLYITASVLIEAANMIHARVGRASAQELLRWVATPGNRTTVLPEEGLTVERAAELMGALEIDCVDALLLLFADAMTAGATLARPAKIATFDMNDFRRTLGRTPMRYRVYDVELDQTFVNEPAARWRPRAP